ncbi:MAG: class I tRNA ligase family protein, partial [Microbacteriaceae bacterium]|nr:class I tRNA ligase family protein [Microbacteriaceae bacterium]
ENELAQARAAGHRYANHWMHNALVTVKSQKMSKSLGNGVLAADLMKQAPPLVVRYALASAHYRSELDLHDGFLAEAASALGRIETFLSRAHSAGIDTTTGDVPDAFAQAMDEDLGIPQALAVIHEAVREGNQAFDDDKTKVAGRLAGSVRAMMAILGLDPLDSAWSAGSSQSASALSSVVESVLDLRAQAKAEKDFAQSDALRAILDMAGIDVSDGPTKSTWSIRG